MTAPFAAFFHDLEVAPLLDKIEVAAAAARVPATPTNAQISRMCNLWSHFHQIAAGEHPLIACISPEIC